jgi:FKBP-type peptidyl-prolyl cis-trans isomerase
VRDLSLTAIAVFAATALSPVASGLAANRAEPKVTPPPGPPPHGLVIKNLIKGRGPAARSGEELSVNYVGVLFRGGKEFDSSWKRGEPFTFPLGSREVIKGWERGLRGMKVGGRRELVIPPGLAYGRAGQPPVIPPRATLVFVIDLLRVSAT